MVGHVLSKLEQSKNNLQAIEPQGKKKTIRYITNNKSNILYKLCKEVTGGRVEGHVLSNWSQAKPMKKSYSPAMKEKSKKTRKIGITIDKSNKKKVLQRGHRRPCGRSCPAQTKAKPKQLKSCQTNQSMSQQLKSQQRQER